MNQINTIEGGKSDAHTELNIQYNPKFEGMSWWCELIKSIHCPITALKPRSGEQLTCGGWRGGVHTFLMLLKLPCLCRYHQLFFPISLWRSLSQSGERTAGSRKSPSAEPRAHTNPLTSQGNQLRTPAFCFSAWAKNIRQIYNAIISVLEVLSKPAFDFWVFDLAKGQEELWFEFLEETQYNAFVAGDSEKKKKRKKASWYVKKKYTLFCANK